MTDFYVFLDLETTGLDPKLDQILELAWVTTDATFSTENSSWGSMLIEPKNWADYWARMNGNPFVHKMHTESGLLKEFFEAADHNELVPVNEAFIILENHLGNFAMRNKDSHGDPATLHLAGLSVHFDKAFLQANAPAWWFGEDNEALFHHRMLDLSSVKMMFEASGVAWYEPELPPLAKLHRAMTDVEHTIRQAREFRKLLQSAFEDHMLVESKVLGDL